MQSMRMKSPWVESFRNLPLVLASLIVVVLAVELLVKLRPAFVEGLRIDVLGFAGNVGVGSSWATLFGASVSLVAVALTAAVLAGFANGVQAAPYFALAPPLVAFSAFAIGAVPIDLPLAMDTRWLAAASALIWLGGGVLLLGRSTWHLVAGFSVTAAPVIWLGIAYSRSQVHSFDGSAQLLMLVLALASIGAPLIAFAERRVRAGRDTDDEVGEQLLRLSERAERSEARAELAERQLASVGTRRATRDDLAATARLQRPRPAIQWRNWGLVLLALGAAAAAYVVGYVPLRADLDATLERNAQAEQQVQALSALRQGYERERAELEAQLRAASARAAQAETVLAATSAIRRSASPEVPAASPVDGASSVATPSRKAPRTTARQPAKPLVSTPQPTRPSAAPPASQRAAPASDDLPRLNERSDDPLEGLE